MFSYILGLYLLDASVTATPTLANVVNNQKWLQVLADVLKGVGGCTSTRLRNADLGVCPIFVNNNKHFFFPKQNFQFSLPPEMSCYSPFSPVLGILIF